MSGAKALDSLTGLPGRSQFEADFAGCIAKKSKDPIVVSLAVVDIDLFGAINKRYGRDGGDAVLSDVASSMAGFVTENTCLYRFGGDAFAVMMAGIEKEQAFLQMEQFRVGYVGLRSVLVGETGHEIDVSISVGVATYSDDGTKAPDVVHRANEALYRAKVSGRNKICLAREEKMVTKTSHYMQGQLLGLRRLAEREQIGEAVLLREALNDLLRKYNA